MFSLALFCLVTGLALQCQLSTSEALVANAHLICTACPKAYFHPIMLSLSPVTSPSYQCQQKHILQLISCTLRHDSLSIYRPNRPSNTAEMSTCILSFPFLAFSHTRYHRQEYTMHVCCGCKPRGCSQFNGKQILFPSSYSYRTCCTDHCVYRFSLPLQQ
jgi:hypothetical protein